MGPIERKQQRVKRAKKLRRRRKKHARNRERTGWKERGW